VRTLLFGELKFFSCVLVFDVTNLIIFLHPFRMYDIEAVINAMKVKKVDRRATTMIQVPAGLPNDKKLGPRCQHIHKFLASEIRLADTLATMVLAVIHPMLEASKGTVLKVVNVTQNNFKTADGNTAVQVVANVNNKALFEDKNSNSKYQTQAIMEALQAADVQIFLHAAEALATGLRDFVDTLRLQCTTGGMLISSFDTHLFAHFLTNYDLWLPADWTEEGVVLGAVFTSPNSAVVFNNYKSYCSEQQGVLRLLKTHIFNEFYQEADSMSHTLGAGTFQDVLQNPRDRYASIPSFLSYFHVIKTSHLCFFAQTCVLQFVFGAASRVDSPKSHRLRHCQGCRAEYAGGCRGHQSSYQRQEEPGTASRDPELADCDGHLR
jgi:hypothetical protein